MLEKNNKISVLPKMMGLAKQIEPQFIVPQNSITNVRHKIFSEYQTLDGKTTVQKCPHCENMAKNFAYLENLIRTNYNEKDQCSLCSSSLKYLQYVNKSIGNIFGNFDTIVQAAQASAMPRKARKSNPKLPKALSRTKPTKLHGSSHSSYTPSVKNPSSKNRLLKKKSRISKLTVKTKLSKKPGNGLVMPAGSSAITRSKNTLKKDKKKIQITSHTVRTAEGAFENGSKFIRSKLSDASKLKSIKFKASGNFSGRKHKGIKSKRNMGSLITK